MLTATLDRDRKVSTCASPSMSPLYGAYDRYRLDANNECAQTRKLVEYVEDQWRKTAEYRKSRMISGTELRSESKNQALPFGSGLMGSWLTKQDKNYWAPANDKKCRLLHPGNSVDQPASGIKQGYNAYTTGSIFHDREHSYWRFSRLKYAPMKWPITLTVQLLRCDASWGLGAEFLAHFRLSTMRRAQMNNYAQYSLPRWTRIRTYAYLLSFKNVFKMKQTCNTNVHVMFDMITLLDYLEGNFMLKQWCCQGPVVQEDSKVL